MGFGWRDRARQPSPWHANLRHDTTPSTGDISAILALYHMKETWFGSAQKAPSKRAPSEFTWILLEFLESLEFHLNFTRISLEAYWNFTWILITYLNLNFLAVPFGRVPFGFFQLMRYPPLRYELEKLLRGVGGWGDPQQDTKEYLNQRGSYTGVFRESKGGIKGEVKRGEVVREWTRPEKEGGGKKGGRKGARKRTQKTLILVPYDLGTL